MTLDESALNQPRADTGAEKSPSKRERFKQILEHLAADAPARDAQGAHAMVANAFSAVELSLSQKHRIELMSVIAFDDGQMGTFNGRKYWTQVYENDMLILGENGAIEIRSTRERIAPSDDTPFANLPLVFQKPGADGKGVWERAT